jgi:hypothetical protein
MVPPTCAPVKLKLPLVAPVAGLVQFDVPQA